MVSWRKCRLARIQLPLHSGEAVESQLFCLYYVVCSSISYIWRIALYVAYFNSSLVTLALLFEHLEFTQAKNEHANEDGHDTEAR